MKYLVTIGAVLLVVVALSPITASAKPPQKNGGSWNGGSWNGGPWNNGAYWGRGYGYGYYDRPYIVQRPIYMNPVVEPAFSGAPIKIVNPPANKVTLSYMLNGASYSIPVGQSQELREDRLWVIDFSRGEKFGQARYSLEPGVYSFTMTDHGWELYHKPLEEVGSVTTPSNPTPPALLPANPTPGR